MGPNTTDRRIRRTQEAIRKAFESLIEEKGYGAVTVQDILDRADVGRSTFYSHYRDKEDLLSRGFDDIRSSLSLAAEGHRGPEKSARESELLGPTLTVFEHVGRYRHTWKPLVRKGGAEVVTRMLRDTAESLIRDHFRRQFDFGADDVRIEMATQFLAGGLMGLLVWWLDSEAPCSAEEVYAVFRQLGNQGAQRFLSVS